MANPPFAGDIKEGQILAGYELGKNAKGKNQTKVGRDILFIERNINFLKPGGRMAIVLPQGRFNNSSDAHIRNFLAEHGRILAVVGLHGNVFKPHTGAKTSVLLWQKWTDDKGINPKKEDYPIFFTTMQKPSKDNSGDKIYIEIETQNGDKERELDHHKHLIVDHDLFNHDGKTQDGIYEAFREFAKREHLSFFFEGLWDIVSFNKERYNKLLESLEVSEVLLSETQKNKDIRLDSQFWANVLPKNPNLEYKKIGEILERSQYGISVSMNEENQGFPIYRMNEIHNMLCDNSVTKCADIPKEEAEQFILKNSDVLFNRTNSYEFVGRTGIFYKNSSNTQPHIFASYLVRITPIQSIILPEFLAVFLNTKIARQEIYKRARQSINQTNVNPEELKEIEIPILKIEIQQIIQRNLQQAHANILQSEKLYSQAETLLLQELDLENYQPDTQNIAEVSLIQMLQTRRMDAEYFQPKYAKFIEHLQNYKNGCETLSELVEFLPCFAIETEHHQENGEILFVRIADISPFELKKKAYISEKLYNEINTEPNGTISDKYQPNKGEILFTKIGTLGVAYHLAEVSQKMIIISNSVRLSQVTELFNGETLTLIINSLIVKQQIQRISGGTVIPFLSLTQIKSIIIPPPLIPQTLQTQIAQKVQQSHELRKESKRLLEVAKKIVEIAIEDGETEAMEFLKV